MNDFLGPVFRLSAVMSQYRLELLLVLHHRESLPIELLSSLEKQETRVRNVRDEADVA
jgi:hypothetical protein